MNEKEIENKLKEIYDFNIEVKFKDFRLYEIYCRVGIDKAFSILIMFDSRYTIEYNIKDIEIKIDREIANLYKKEN